MSSNTYAVNSSWRALFKDLGVEPSNVLRRAGLPEDLFAQLNARIPSSEYFALWESLQAELGDPLLPIKLCEAIRGDSFSPELFAALCSPNLRVAIQRLAQYKPLICPMRLELSGDGSLTLGIAWLDLSVPPPRSLVAMELLFFVALARIGTRAPIRPLRVVTETPPTPLEPHQAYLGAPIETGRGHFLTFSAEDAQRPFLTSNEALWSAFEPDLRRRLAELDGSARTEERVKAALLEGLPSGLVGMETIAKKLGLTKRTLQRRLEAEATTYQKVLQTTRESLARHYLQRTALSTAEISFLLGFEEPNSFYRAFSDWTGQTPERARQSALS